MSDDPQFSHISIHLSGTMTSYHSMCLALTSVRCFPECLLLLCQFPVPFLAWHPLRLLLMCKTSQRKPKPTSFVNPIGLKISRTLAMVTHWGTCHCMQSKEIWDSILCQGSSENQGCKFLFSLQCHNLPEQSELNGRCWLRMDHKEILSGVHYISENTVAITFLQVFL